MVSRTAAASTFALGSRRSNRVGIASAASAASEPRAEHANPLRRSLADLPLSDRLQPPGFVPRPPATAPASGGGRHSGGGQEGANAGTTAASRAPPSPSQRNGVTNGS